VSAQIIEEGLYDAYGSRQVSTIYAPNDEFWVIMEVLPEFQSSPATLSLLYVRSSGGKLVAARYRGQVHAIARPLQINHSGQPLPSATISFDVAPAFRWQGARRSQKLSGASCRIASRQLPGNCAGVRVFARGLGMLLVMTILVHLPGPRVLYESFIHPITILSGLPSAGFGALLTLWVFGMELDLFAFVGVIMLVGLVKKNAIMMIDFALDAQRTEGKTPTEAIFGMLSPLPANHDDHDGRADGTLPIAIRTRRRRGGARPLGVAVRRRIILLAVPDADTSRRCSIPTWKRSLERFNAWREGRVLAPMPNPHPNK